MDHPARTHRYPWLGGPLSWAQMWSTLAALALGGGAAVVYLRYLRSGGDVAPDSAYGYGFALAGTAILLLVGASYFVRKRWARHGRGRLHTWMAWHIAGGCLGVALIFMHAAGNFHPRTGTYALYALIVLIVSGVIGRALDRICPRLAARAALGALTESGAERLDNLTWQVTALRMPAPPDRAPAATHGDPRMARGQPWDIAYLDLDPEVEAIPSFFGGSAAHAAAAQPAAPVALPRAVRREAASLRATLSREEFWLALVRVWRRLHLLLSVVFVALLAWHIEFALTLLWNAR